MPFVLLGGVAEDEDLWRELRPLLSASIVCDARPSSTTERSVAGAARSVAGVLSEPAILVGHSLGGLVALAVAARAPECVAGIVLVAAGYPVEVNPRIYELLEHDPRAAADALGVAAAGGRARQADQASRSIAERFAAMVTRTEPDRVVIDLRACEAYQLDVVSESAPRIRALAGAEDRMMRLSSVAGLAALVGARLTVIADAGHQLPWERPQLVAAACRELRTEVAQ